jgi:hypothetical protein
MSKEPEASKSMTLEELMQAQNALALKRELREQAELERQDAERLELAATRSVKEKKRQLTDAQSAALEIAQQKSCSHLKNRAGNIEGPHTFHNIYAHQLPTGDFFIKCRNKCGMRWNYGDTKEFLFRKDAKGIMRKIPNHTGLSFGDMWLKLPPDSISRSEIVTAAQPPMEPVAA